MSAIDFTRVLTNMDGEPIVDQIDPGPAKDRSLTLGRAAAHALCANFQDDKSSADEKFRRGMLAYQVRDEAAATLKADDIAIIKKAIAKLFGPMVVYQAWPLLDPAEK